MYRVKRATPGHFATFDDLAFKMGKSLLSTVSNVFHYPENVPSKIPCYGVYFTRKYRISTRTIFTDIVVLLNVLGFSLPTKKRSLVSASRQPGTTERPDDRYTTRRYGGMVPGYGGEVHGRVVG